MPFAALKLVLATNNIQATSSVIFLPNQKAT